MPTSIPDPKARDRHSHPKSEPRGGFIVHRRGSNRGDLIGRVRPTEHGSLESARTEAARLAGIFDREFVVFQEVAAVVPATSASQTAA